MTSLAASRGAAPPDLLPAELWLEIINTVVFEGLSHDRSAAVQLAQTSRFFYAAASKTLYRVVLVTYANAGRVDVLLESVVIL